MDKVSLFILNILINSFLAFFTVALLIEVLLWLCRIPQGRVAAMLRMIPLVKLPLDCGLYDFSRWSYLHGIHPLECAEGTRTLSVVFGNIRPLTEGLLLPFFSTIEFTVPGNMTFTIADVMGTLMGPMLVQIFACGFMVIHAALCVGISLRHYRGFLLLKAWKMLSEPALRSITMPTLQETCQRYRVQMRTSPTGSPFVVGISAPVIYLSRHLSSLLSDQEYTAVTAHEIEHVRYKDGLVCSVLGWITTLFWWVPTQWLLRRIHEGIERGCDLSCTHYGIDPIDLASAIRKSTEFPLPFADNPLFSPQYFAKPILHRRVQALLQMPSPQQMKRHLLGSCLAVSVGVLTIIPGKFWIF